MTDFRFSLPDQLDRQVRASLARWQSDRLATRLWEGDASLWTGGEEARWLGWLRTVDEQRARVDLYARLGDEIRSDGFSRALLLGMGGSSLAPEVLGRTLGHAAGFPSLQILDSTDPAQVRTAAGGDLASTIVIVASKSGSTLEPNILKQYFYERVREIAGDRVGRRFIAITDPGSQLEQIAAKEGFRHILHGDPSIGGRFSALSGFGIAPAAIAGLDIGRLLRRAADMVSRCGPDRPAIENPGVVLGTILGEGARAGRDKLTLIAPAGIAGLGAWLEQLLAESTGKNGKAILPIDGEVPATADVYGTDRLFAQLRLRSAPDEDLDRAVDALEQAGHPVVRIDIADPYELGAEFFRWEMATAVAGAILKVNPFDQPDVESAKQITRRLAAEYESTGRLPQEMPIFQDHNVAVFTDERNVAALQAGLKTRLYGGTTLAPCLGAHFSRLQPGDYTAILAYLSMTSDHIAALQGIRHRIRDAAKVATSVGFGPRYLHSTGQAHKGGPNTGLFLLITADDAHDLAVPGQRYTFGVIKAAQARGDFEALTARGRRALRVHLGADVSAGLATLEQAVADALR